jgi:hypothetical protein
MLKSWFNSFLRSGCPLVPPALRERMLTVSALTAVMCVIAFIEFARLRL